MMERPKNQNRILTAQELQRIVDNNLMMSSDEDEEERAVADESAGKYQ